MNGDESTPTKRARLHLGVSELLLVLIFLVSGGGVALTDISPTWGYWFWVAMVPLLALTSIHAGWVRARARGEGGFWILRKQIFHWLGLLGALELIFLLFYSTGRIDAPEVGLFSMLAVALATFLAGVHFHWHFAVLGVLLGGATILVAWVEASVWVVIPVALIAVVVVMLLSRYSNKRRSA